MKKLVEKLRGLVTRRDDGASAVEYGLLVALIAVVIAGTVFFLGGALRDKLDCAKETVANNGAAVPEDCVQEGEAPGGGG